MLADAERAAPRRSAAAGRPAARGHLHAGHARRGRRARVRHARAAPAAEARRRRRPLVLARGDAGRLAVVGLAATGDADAATLRRVMPNGVVREPSTAGGIATRPAPAPRRRPAAGARADRRDRRRADRRAHRARAGDRLPALAASGLVSLALDPPAPRPASPCSSRPPAPTTATIASGRSRHLAYVEPSTGG